MNLGGSTSLMGILMVVFLGKDLEEDLRVRRPFIPWVSPFVYCF